MDTCNCYHPAFLSHTTSYEKWELCQLEVTDEKEDQEMYECVMEIMKRLTLSIPETLFCKPFQLAESIKALSLIYDYLHRFKPTRGRKLFADVRNQQPFEPEEWRPRV